MAYCLPADLYEYGLPRGALASPGRMVESVNTAGNSIELDAHGFAADTEVQFRTAGGGELPDPLAPGVQYYAIPVDDWRFQIATSSGGSALNLTTEGTTFLALSPLPVDAAIEAASREIDDMLPSCLVPLADPVAPIIRMSTAELAAWKLTALTGAQGVSYTTVYDATHKRVARWGRHVPVRGVDAPPTAQRSAVASASHRTSWQKYAGIA